MASLHLFTIQHDVQLLLLAATFCVAGSAVSLRIFRHAFGADAGQRLGWLFLTAVACGSTAWCTHFIVLMGLRTAAPVAFDPWPTTLSLVFAILGSLAGFVVAVRHLGGIGPRLGGALVGAAIAATHYVGIRGFRVDGMLSWNPAMIILSVIGVIGLASLALHHAMRQAPKSGRLAITLLLGAIAVLNVFAMAAFEVTPTVATGTPFDPGPMQSMAVVVAAVGMVIITTGLAIVVIDGRTRSESFARLHHMAMHDALTGLANRNSFNEHVDRQIRIARQAGTGFAVIGIDLDRFKEINDQRGHQYGDEALRILGGRMMELATHGEFVARIGGDEFAAVRPFDDREELVEFLTRLKGAFYRPLEMDGYEITTGASLGVALFPQDGDTREALVSNADLAMYRAKSDPLRAICFYDSSMDDVVRRNRQLATDLRLAIEREGLEVHYQVQRSIAGGQITGYEALVRWNHPARGYIAPSEFIPLAEECGLIYSLGEWVLRRACADAMTWSAPYKVAVNLSAIQLAAGTLPDLVRDVLGTSGLPPHRLEFELTESSIMRDRERSLRAMQGIKAHGVRIALDDFGTGYSSLATLRLFPIDKIKLDRAFIADVDNSQESIAIVRAVLALGKSLKIPVLAEGIERQAQIAVLRAEGCDEAQGYLLGCPAPLRMLSVATGRTSTLARDLPSPRRAGAAEGQWRPVAVPALPMPDSGAADILAPGIGEGSIDTIDDADLAGLTTRPPATLPARSLPLPALVPSAGLLARVSPACDIDPFAGESLPLPFDLPDTAEASAVIVRPSTERSAASSGMPAGIQRAAATAAPAALDGAAARIDPKLEPALSRPEPPKRRRRKPSPKTVTLAEPALADAL